ncbi:MAG: ion transporter [Bacteroidales bacterium]
MDKPKVYNIIFKSDTKQGKQFDVILLWVIGLSVLIAMFDSLPLLSPVFNRTFTVAEWFFTILFTIEYAVRIYVSPKPHKYVFSFWGIIDLVAVFPTYLSLLFYGYQYLLIIRILRMLRVFRVLRMVRFSREGNTLLIALKASAYKIGIFFFTVICFVIILGTVMYVVEGPENGFTSIFQSIYWAIITITTVGYGDIVPLTVLGKIISSFTMIIGYAIIAVPTGIVTVEMSKTSDNNSKCPECESKNSERAKYCNNCGVDLKEK